MEKMTHTMNVSQPLSSATSMLAQWVCEPKSNSNKDEIYRWSLMYGPSLTKAHLATDGTKCLNTSIAKK